ncbi:MAG TPA: ShlB/FhaC/HecB family hemolysin secretion/activation protein [Aliidongia sp.]|uniref:ShlB/FhaC/HecB family hemolysin secretion/activation protein n=1 Tax=Aliidongia sp. TaxID=1914230 RepID=UPI002DDD4477|nr:ShlB/FhaC/HecB family hemolysin secretion/activation protein [Aliidongia sp.]HEV2676331.1 ShlB/FhaC/HecB family hemolysin secretion/activation protein [Aliidongia sp.]
MIPAVVWAQAVPVIPPSIDPNRLSDQLKGPAVRPPTTELDVPAPAPEAVPPANAEKVQFVLSRVTIEGAVALPADSFAPVYGARVGQTVTLAEVYQWADAITRAYRDAGYILSRAVVPAQKISGGAVRISVIEGYINQVTVQGDSSPKLVAYGEQLKASRPLKSEDLERYLLLANELPGLTVRSVLNPSATVPGASDLTLVATEKTLDFNFELDNRGTRYIGPWQGYASVGINDVLGLNERTSFRYATTPSIRELSYMELDESVPIDDDGTSLLFTASRTRAAPGFTLADLGTHTTAETLLFGVKHEFIRQRSEDLTVGLNFDYRDGTTRLKLVPGDLTPTSDDKVRALRLNGTYDVADALDGQDQVNFELSHGLPILNASRFASPIASRLYGDPEFSKLVVGVARTTGLGGDFAVLTALQGQTAFGGALLQGEQFGLGGAAFGRGYDPSEITGDDGIAGKIELQWTPNLNLGELRYTQFYTFYDLGEVVTRHTNLPFNGLRDVGGGTVNASLASAGVGTRLALFDNYTSNIELAKPLTRELAADRGHGDAKSWHLFFSLNASF